MPTRLLLIEDEKPVRDMLRFALADKAYQILEAENAQQALGILASETPDVVLLDWMLPDLSGPEFARRMRREKNWQNIPIIMLTARSAEDDKIKGLDSGADDYLTKPFSTRELQARIRAVLRRFNSDSQAPQIEYDGLLLNVPEHRVSVNGKLIQLGPTEFKLLHFFLATPERVHSREQILDNVWGQNVYVEERTVDVHIRRLRKGLQPFGYERYIKTVRGFGYRFSRYEVQ